MTPQDRPLDDIEAIRQYLNAAPPSVAAWAAEQLAQLDAQSSDAQSLDAQSLDAQSLDAQSLDAQPLDAQSLDAQSSPPVDTSPEEYEPHGFEDDDDLIVSRRQQRRQTSNSQGTDAVRSSRGWMAPLAVALVAGVAFGIWFSDRGGAGSSPEQTTPNLTADSTGADSFDRIVELEYELSKDPQNVDANLELGVLLFNRGDLDAAGKYWDPVLALDPQQADAWYNIGFLRLSENPPDVEGAKNAWENVTAFAPDSEMAKTAQMHLSGLDAAQSASDSDKDIP